MPCRAHSEPGDFCRDEVCILAAGNCVAASDLAVDAETSALTNLIFLRVLAAACADIFAASRDLRTSAALGCAACTAGIAADRDGLISAALGCTACTAGIAADRDGLISAALGCAACAAGIATDRDRLTSAALGCAACAAGIAADRDGLVASSAFAAEGFAASGDGTWASAKDKATTHATPAMAAAAGYFKIANFLDMHLSPELC